MTRFAPNTAGRVRVMGMTLHTAPPVRLPVVRVSGPQGIVAAVPQLLGFSPENSLVLVCLTAPRGRVGPVARVDIFPPDAEEPVAQLVNYAKRYAQAAVIVCYHDWDGRPACVDALTRALEGAGIPVDAALSVHGDRIRDATSDRAMARDSGVPPLGAGDASFDMLAAASAIAGRRVLPTRSELAASIAAPPSAAQELIAEAIASSRKRHAALLRGAERRLTEPLARAVDAALRCARNEQDATGSVRVETAADLAVLTEHIGCRDQVLARAIGSEDPAFVPTLIATARRLPDSAAAEICAVLAATAYRFGDGALAHCAADRALATAPAHRLGLLLRAAFTGGIPPGDLAVLADIEIPGDGAAPSRRQRRARSRRS